jgi:hypothetical protein
MRLMSFALTTPQILDQSKTVTRRIGWATLTPGTLIQPVRKVMGRKKGEPVEYLGPPIRVVRVSRQQLNLIEDDPGYGQKEMILEGFPAWEPWRFVDFFLNKTGAKQTVRTLVVTRIQFEYTEGRAGDA